MSSRYTAYHFDGTQGHLFCTDTLPEAYNFLFAQADSGQTTPKSILTILEGPDDQVIYYKKSQTSFYRLKVWARELIWVRIGEKLLRSIHDIEPANYESVR